jgi:hypothetical protein
MDQQEAKRPKDTGISVKGCCEKGYVACQSVSPSCQMTYDTSRFPLVSSPLLVRCFWLITLAMLFGPQVLTKVGLPVWLVIVGIGIVVVGRNAWNMFRAGYFLYLRPRAVPPMPPQPGIVIHVIGWTGIFPLMIRVFIDGKCAGVLNDKHAKTVPVSVGPHQVMVKRDFLRSKTLAVSVPPGERAELECGWHMFYSQLIIWAIVLIMVVLQLPKVGLLQWLVIVVFIGIVASGLYRWMACTTAGYTLYLRPRAVPPMPSAEDAPSTPRRN